LDLPDDLLDELLDALSSSEQPTKQHIAMSETTPTFIFIRFEFRWTLLAHDKRDLLSAIGVRPIFGIERQAANLPGAPDSDPARREVISIEPHRSAALRFIGSPDLQFWTRIETMNRSRRRKEALISFVQKV